MRYRVFDIERPSTTSNDFQQHLRLRETLRRTKQQHLSIKHLLHTSVFTALCALALCLGAERLMLGHRPPFFSALHFFIVGSTLAEYNVHHLFNQARSGIPWASSAMRPHWIVSIIGLGMCVYSLPGLPLSVIVACAVLGFISLAYSTPLLPFRYKARLKDYGLLKIHILTGVWVAVGTVLPGLYWKIPLSVYWIELVVRSLLIFPLCIAFDIRDVEADHEIGINTLPNTLGLKAAYLAINITLLVFLAGGLARCLYRGEPLEMWAYLLSAGITYFAIRLSKRNPHPYVYLLLIDGVMLQYGLLQYLL